LRFRGRKLGLVTAYGPKYGRAKIVIDGVGHYLNLYRRARDWRSKIFYTGLGKGEHEVVFRPLGKKDRASSSTQVVFDAFEVRH
jgi:hypothetical protein